MHQKLSSQIEVNEDKELPEEYSVSKLVNAVIPEGIGPLRLLEDRSLKRHICK